MKRQNDRILREELPRSVGAQYATGDQWSNNSRKNEGMEPKQKQHKVVNGNEARLDGIEARLDAILLFIAANLASITGSIHNWVLFLL